MKTTWIVLGLCLLTAASTLLLDSCRKAPFVAATPLAFPIPPGFGSPRYNFAANPLTEEGFVLGRRLFYDGRLSKNGAFSCASCHNPEAAFTTFEHDRSHGYGNSHTLRNAPGLFNLAWYPAFRQDGSGSSIEAVALAHLQAPNEMGETLPSVLNKINGDTAYQRLFRAAFGQSNATEETLGKALAQFVVSLVSADAKWDRVQRGEAAFSPQEENGAIVFQRSCASCHTPPLFTDFSYRNNGLPLFSALSDFGRMRVTGNRQDSLRFRVPSLRNLTFTSYYGHDGRFPFFRHMITHYRQSVQPGPTLDPLLAGGLKLSDAEEDQLVAFLHTLSDSSFLLNQRFRE